MVKKERIIGLDLVRCVAIFGVFITHFIAYTHKLDGDVLSIKWAIFMVIRFFAMSSVPLFLLLTGYLNNKKEISKKYYKGIFPILISYIVISLGECILLSVYNHELFNIGQSFVKILNFTANDYAWYFEMYIGLFLLAPFLNILYDNLKSPKEKYILIGSLVFLTLLPNIAKSFKLYGVWADVTPDYWQIIYPITYFYIGKLIKEKMPKLKMGTRLGLFAIALLIPTLTCYIFSIKDGTYAWYIFNGFEALTTSFVAVSIFLGLYDINKKVPVLKNIITEISLCSFEMYLISSIVDKYYYSHLNYSFPIMILLVAITTYVAAKILILIRDKLFQIIDNNQKI